MFRTITIACLMSVCLLGCATPNFNRAETAAMRVAVLRTSVTELRQTTDWTLGALDQVAKDGDPHLTYLQLQNSTADLDQREQRMFDRAEELRSRITVYFDQWQKELPAIQDSDVRQASANRRMVLIDTYNRVPPLVNEVRAQSQAYSTQLRDLEKFFGNDLTAAGARVASPFVDRSKQAGSKLQADVDALLKELDTVAAALTPIRPVVPAPPAASR